MHGLHFASVAAGIFSNVGVVEIELTDENDQVEVYSKDLQVPENSRVNTIVRAQVEGQTELVESFDQDVADTLTYSIVGGNDAGFFAIDPCNGQVRVDKEGLNHELKNMYVLRVRVEDDGRPNITWAEADVYVNVTDVNDRPTMTDMTITIPENSYAGTVVGAISARDEDNNTLYWSLHTGDADGFFEFRAIGRVDNTSSLYHGTSGSLLEYA